MPFSTRKPQAKQYQQRTSLRPWGFRQRALQVSHRGYSTLTWRHEHKPQEPWRMWERDAEWSALTNAHHIHSASVLSGTIVTQRHDVPWDWLQDACHMAGVHWGSRCEGFCSKEGPHYCFEQIARNPLERDQVQIALRNCPEAVIRQGTTNLIHEFGNPLRIPYSSGTALLSRAYLMRESWAQGFLWVRRVWFAFSQRRFAPETFGKRQKGERSPVVSLLPGSCKCLALRNPHVLCQKYGGACTTYYLGVLKVQENGTRKWISVQRRKAQRNQWAAILQKYLNKKVAIKIRDTCEKKMFTLLVQ